MADTSPLETTRTRAILKWINAQPGMRAIKYHGSPFSHKGEPDIIACVHGLYVALEVKRKEGIEPSKAQLQRIAEVRAAGGIAEVVTTLEEAQKVIGQWT